MASSSALVTGLGRMLKPLRARAPEAGVPQAVAQLSQYLILHQSAVRCLSGLNPRILGKGVESSRGLVSFEQFVQSVADISLAAREVSALMQRDLSTVNLSVRMGEVDIKLPVVVRKDLTLETQREVSLLINGKAYQLAVIQGEAGAMIAGAPGGIDSRHAESSYTGIGVSSGTALGRAFQWAPWERGSAITRYEIPEDQVEAEVGRLNHACEAAQRELTTLKETAAGGGHQDLADIMEGHILILLDIARQAALGIRKVRLNAEHMVGDVIDENAKIFEAMEHERFRSRIDDLKDVGRTLLRHLSGGATTALPQLSEDVVIVAKEILPQDLAAIVRAGTKVVALVTERGGHTSHAAIIARKLGIPAVVGIRDATKVIPEGRMVGVDGERGIVVTNPSEGVKYELKLRAERARVLQSSLVASVRGKPSETLDGRGVRLSANIDRIEELEEVEPFEAEAVGLFRTEYLYMDRDDLPTEEEIFQILLRIPAALPFVFRTADLGGDKQIPESLRHLLGGRTERTTFMGLRGARFYFHSEATRKLLETQIRAVLRASAERPELALMFPMISGVRTMRRLRAVVQGCMDQLEQQGTSFNQQIRVGTMIETPSATEEPAELARVSDFFSFGTNDLIQYTLVVDRGDDMVAGYYDPFHISVLRKLQRVVLAAEEAGIPVSVCGDMARDPVAALVLLGLGNGTGIHSLSVSPRQIPFLKHVIRSVKAEDCRRLARKLLQHVSELGAGGTDQGAVLAAITEIFGLDFAQQIAPG